MPLHQPRSRLSRRFAIILGTVIVLAGIAGWRIVTLGQLLHHEDALQKADVIFVLAGTRMERVAEGGDLWLEGWAPKILLSRPERDGGEIALVRRGVAIPSELDLQRDALVAMGVPAAAIEGLDDEQLATAMESTQLFELARARGWRTIIVVTSKLHTGRARLAIERRFSGTGVQIVMRGSRYDPSNVERWWTRRGTFRFVLFEAQKMFAYWIGAAD